MSEPASALLPTSHQQLFGIALSLIFLTLIVFLVRQRRLRMEFSVLWLLTGVIAVALASSKSLLLLVVRISGATLPASALFLVAIFFLFAINIYHTATISSQSEIIRKLAIQIALLQEQMTRHDAENERE